MMSRFALLLAVGATFLQGAATCPGHGNADTMLVTPAWLTTHLKDPGLVVIGVGPKAEFDKGHIPGSVSLELNEVSAKGSKLTLELPTMPELAETFGALGVTNTSRVILYSIGSSVQSTTRVFLTLDAMGLGKNAALLDGGLASWTGATTTEPTTVKKGIVEPCAQNDVITDMEFVGSNMRHPGVDIVDARATPFYTGQQIPVRQRAGHIPGAVNIPFDSMFDEKGKFKSPLEMKVLLKAAGIKPGEKIVSYCHIGQQATVIYFVARYLGFDARLYDGSWQEWSLNTELPREISPQR